MIKNLLKIALILVLVLSFSSYYVSATDIDLNLPGLDSDQTQEVEENTNSEPTQSTENQDEVLNNETANENSEDFYDEDIVPTDDMADINPITDVEDLQPSGITSTPSSTLSATNIINILLITVGVILVLLAIAIIIRLK